MSPAALRIGVACQTCQVLVTALCQARWQKRSSVFNVHRVKLTRKQKQVNSPMPRIGAQATDDSQRNTAMDYQMTYVARVIYEDRINEYSLRRVDYKENAFALVFKAFVNAILILGRNEATRDSAKPKTLATR
jgi:hypothetical protein